MSTTPLNPTKQLLRQGIDSSITYIGKVVDVEDPYKRGRVRVRIYGIHSDEIPDNHLPWALNKPSTYGKGKGAADRCGSFSVPPVDSKVGIKFVNRDPHKPYLTALPPDEETILDEALVNYPHRKLIRFSNGCYIIVDALTNELLLNNSGDMHVTVLGDCTQTIVGNHQLMVTGSVDDIPSFLLNASDTKIAEINAKTQGRLNFSKMGSQLIHVKGDQTIIVEGNQTVDVKGHHNLKVGKNYNANISGEHEIKSSRSNTN